MKIIFLSILLLVALFSATSCKKKESPTKSTNSNSFTLKKDGVLYSPNYILVSQVDEDALSVETHIVNQYPWDNSYVIFIKRSISPGTYLGEDGESDYFSLIHNQDSTNMFGWETSSLTVLSNDTLTGVLHCTFEVLLYNDDCEGSCPQITDGEMTIHY
ncbi:MAG: hypothetical protein K0S23_3130 [Fluviicola sp.]|jgi:hypothetical protein|uniref:hypothetical protein n=1 Tax=Fluviicola sp. TaxID=1917219 RepID=UPI002638659C|nr:hypothetical protein [Fluviicola sp.]MDF3028823.1 hypothetical protein [Fluviicola sp.]